jgi:hypothetical protein
MAGGDADDGGGEECEGGGELHLDLKVSGQGGEVCWGSILMEVEVEDSELGRDEGLELMRFEGMDDIEISSEGLTR